jgi:uncharacterized protein (TIGR02001 family)
MHNSIRGLCGGLLLAATAASWADTAVTGNVTLATDYRFRGISQTDRDPAIQGGFDLGTDSGLYLGTWASNIQFAGSMEWDFYGGWKGDIADGVTLDVGAIYYKYPSANDSGLLETDYVEGKVALSMSGFTVGVNYSPDYTLETGNFWYLFGEYGAALGDVATLTLHVGLNQFEDDDKFGEFGLGDGDDDDDNYIDYFLKLSKDAFGITWALAYVGTDVDDDDECFAGAKVCEGTVVASMTKAL